MAENAGKMWKNHRTTKVFLVENDGKCKCGWKTKALAEKMELSDFSWEIWWPEKRKKQQNFWEKKLSGEIYPKTVDALIFVGDPTCLTIM